MNDQANEVSGNQEPILATRLREAREDVGMSRADLARQTGIPAKSIEKFEYGTQEPSVSRLKTLCEVLDVSREWVMGEDDDSAPSRKPVPQMETQPSPNGKVANKNDPMAKIRKALKKLDNMRADDFEGVQRQAMAMADDILAKLKYLEPDELVADLAEDRGVFKGECPTLSDILNFFAEKPDKAQEYCGQVEERILDTAILGVDLYAIESAPLVGLADRLEMENEILDAPEIFGGWGDHEEFVPLIRPFLRSLAFMGEAEDFEDLEAYPRRE